MSIYNVSVDIEYNNWSGNVLIPDCEKENEDELILEQISKKFGVEKKSIKINCKVITSYNAVYLNEITIADLLMILKDEGKI